MNVLPFKRFTIESSLDPARARARLKEAIGPVRTSLFERSREPFVGKMTGNSFDIMRTVQGRNSVRPRVRGMIESSPTGTVLQGTMKPHELVIGVLAVIIVGPGMLFGNILLASLSSARSNPLMLLIPGALLLLLTLLGIGFAFESRRALRMMAEIVDAERSELR